MNELIKILQTDVLVLQQNKLRIKLQDTILKMREHETYDTRTLDAIIFSMKDSQLTRTQMIDIETCLLKLAMVV